MDSEHVLRLKMEGLFWLGAVLRAEKFSQLRTRYSMNKLETLKSSRIFKELKVDSSLEVSLLLQAYEDKSCNKVKVGYTVSKQNGNAVVRNKIKRRLRVIAKNIIGEYGIKNWNYVIIGKKNSLIEDFKNLEFEMNTAIKKIHS